MLLFGCGRQQKCHTATPSPTKVWRRMERNRLKLVGRDKGSITEQQTKGNSNNKDTEKGNTQNKPAEQSLQNRDTLYRTDSVVRSQAVSEFPSPSSAPPEPSMTAHGIEYRALFGQVGSACPAVPLPGFW